MALMFHPMAGTFEQVTRLMPFAFRERPKQFELMTELADMIYEDMFAGKRTPGELAILIGTLLEHLKETCERG